VINFFLMTALATLEVAALEKSELLRGFHVNGIGEEVESFLSAYRLLWLPEITPPDIHPHVCADAPGQV
jgi:hypothetical protein